MSRLQDKMFTLAFLRMLEVCSLKAIFIDRAVTNPKVSWKSRIKLKPKQGCSRMWNMHSGVTCFHCWLGIPLCCVPFPPHPGGWGKQGVHPAQGIALPVFIALCYSQSFLGGLAHTEIFYCLVSLFNFAHHACVLWWLKKGRCCSLCWKRRPCWNLLEHLSLEGKKSWGKREFPVFCSQWKSLPGQAEKVIVSDSVCPAAWLLGAWCCWLVALVPSKQVYTITHGRQLFCSSP